MRESLSLVSGIVFLLGFVPYVTAILQKKAQPSKASWTIWALTDVVTVAAMTAKGSLNGIIVGALIGATVVALLSLRYGVPGWTKTDKICMTLSCAGIGLWVVTDNANASILINCSVMLIGSITTFASAWEDPKRENKWAWLLYFVSCVIALFAIPQLTIEHAAQPISFMVTETVMIYLVWLRKPPNRKEE